jgi:hypothetical protein
VAPSELQYLAQHPLPAADPTQRSPTPSDFDRRAFASFHRLAIWTVEQSPHCSCLGSLRIPQPDLATPFWSWETALYRVPAWSACLQGRRYRCRRVEPASPEHGLPLWLACRQFPLAWSDAGNVLISFPSTRHAQLAAGRIGVGRTGVLKTSDTDAEAPTRFSVETFRDKSWLPH